MAQTTHSDEIGIVPLWLIVLLGVAWLAITAATFAYVSGIGPLA